MENVTIHYLPPDKPYVGELNEDGEWKRVLVEVPFACTFEFVVAGPFDFDNTIRRKLAPTREHPDGRIIHQQIRRRYVMVPGEKYEIPSVHMPALRRELCVEDACLPNPFGCKDPEHMHQVVGGLAPHCKVVGEVRAPQMHPSIKDEPTPVQPAITEAIAQTSVLSAEERALERARARRVAGGSR